jgi:dihydrofolate reductase
MESIDTILLGRKTYEIFAEFWPNVSTDQEILSDKLNIIPKVVLSNTLTQAPWGKWNEAAVLPGDAIEVVKRLKQQKGKDIVMWGSISVAQVLMQADLVDEYRIHVCPVRLGEGRALFPQKDHDHQLRLVGTKVYDATGVVFLKYVPKR